MWIKIKKYILLSTNKISYKKIKNKYEFKYKIDKKCYEMILKTNPWKITTKISYLYI